MRLVAAAAVLLGAPPQTDLDAFMAKVLERREVNRRTLNDYILSEVESFDVLAPGRLPLYRFKREYEWYVREGIHVRSPVNYDGAPIGEEARRAYEDRWFDRERQRQKREAEKKAKGAGASGEQAPVPGGGGPGEVGVGQVLEPRFVSEAYFLDFKFEPGNYYLVGRESLDGHEVLRVEYYPRKMFTDEPDPNPEPNLTISLGDEPPKAKETKPEGQKPAKPRREQSQKEKDFEDAIERKMNKTSLVTLWIDPAEHQIVQYTFDNVWLDFLPGRWLVRVDDIRASMRMGQPFKGVWLPQAITIHAGVTLASGSYEASYRRTFSDFREADVTSKIRVKDGSR
jgi:hypothetical protein